LDLIAKAASGLVAVESKCIEYLSPKVAKFSDRYRECITDTRPLGRPWFDEMLRLMAGSGQRYELLDVAQLIKHALGLMRGAGKADLIYLYWEPLDSALRRHVQNLRDDTKCQPGLGKV
jgi:hypothetical protein